MRPNTWLHRPSLRREESPCQSGAVHTWHLASVIAAQRHVRSWVQSRKVGPTPKLTILTRNGHLVWRPLLRLARGLLARSTLPLQSRNGNQEAYQFRLPSHTGFIEDAGQVCPRRC